MKKKQTVIKLITKNNRILASYFMILYKPLVKIYLENDS